MNRTQQALDIACAKVAEALNTLEFGLSVENLHKMEVIKAELQRIKTSLNRVNNAYYSTITIHEDE